LRGAITSSRGAKMKHYTTADLAEKFDVSKSTITRTAGRLGIGTRLYGRILFTTKDVKEMEKNGVFKVGNPNFKKISDDLSN